MTSDEEATDTAASDTAPTDDVKRKFKEALDKKNSQKHGGEAHLDANSAITGPHGAVGNKRTFRRKAG
ncbi:hypothetical protein LK09_16230 [Microbacterium mangrovi]|uniref:DUF5302 domain-containing protein n=1 Tax=Microbacterium mangrovi TaxID=1348253 RepID=A0A0B2A3P1_9MICO|nr:DUF5302 domain-containing protein [Microbacterium mangrovi]KHK96183.1 hypothetical protein LK09_16230 [Microbacterium mangrovi]